MITILHSQPPKQRWGKPGSFSVLFAFSIVLLLASFSMVLDFGQLYWVKHRNQIAAEAAALAAVKMLNQTPAGLRAACEEAAAMVHANSMVTNEFAFVANCQTPLASTNEIKFGIWDEDARTFTSSAEPLAINAVQVNVSRLQSKGNAVVPILMGAFDSAVASGIDVSSLAVAISSEKPASEANIFPLGASSCGFLNSSSQLACGREIVVGDGPGSNAASNCPNNPSDCVVDNTGNYFKWTAGTNKNAGTSAFRDMANALVNCMRGNSCSPTHVAIGDIISLDGGNHAGTFNSSGSLLPDYLASHGTIDVQVAIFRAPGSCSSSNSAGDAEIIGFGTFRINKVVSTGSNKYLRGSVICGVTTTQPGDSNASNFGTIGSSNSIIVR